MVKEMYDKEDPARRKEYINIADPENPDPVVRDAWNTLSWDIKGLAAEAFGQDRFLPVRKELVKDVLGYRAASVTDAWTGVTRMDPKTQKVVRGMMESIIGKKAFEYLKRGEDVVGDVVSYAKTTIIVRSVVVSVGNMMSNLLHLSLRGVNPIQAATKMREKFVEVTQYVRNDEELLKLKVQLASNVNNPQRAKQLRARIRSLEESQKRLSIHPLIEAGEFSTVSEDLTEADVELREGRWGDALEKATDKLPGWAGTLSKNALVTKDTELFRALNRMVQYGDFLAKAVLYDHLVEEKGKTREEAMDVIMEEFVQYNRLPGRGRDFAEQMGLLWFFSYKLRIMKVVTRMMRENPVNGLALMGGR